MSTTPYTSPYGAAGTTNIPGGSQYARAALLANQQYKQRLADLNKQRQQSMITAGYTGDIDPESGLLKNFRVDPTSKFGGFQLLNRAQAQQGEDVRGQNIERGLGTGGGLAAQNRANARFDWARQDTDFARGVQDQFSAFDRTQMDWLFERDQALYNAELQAAQSAIGAGDYGDYGGDPGYPPDYGDSGQEPGLPAPGSQPMGVRRLLPAATRKKQSNAVIRKSKAAVNNQKLSRYGWGAAATVAKAKKPLPKKKPVPGKYRAWGPR